MNYWTWQRVLKFVLVAATARTTLCLFCVQEMIAALIIFSVLFACVVGLVLMVITLDCATEAAFASIEAHTGRGRQMKAKTTCSRGDALGPTFGSDITN